MADSLLDPFEGITPIFPELIQTDIAYSNPFDAIACDDMVGLDAELEADVAVEQSMAQRAGADVGTWHISEPLPPYVAQDPRAAGFVNAVTALDQWYYSWNSRPPETECDGSGLARSCWRVCLQSNVGHTLS